MRSQKIINPFDRTEDRLLLACARSFIVPEARGEFQALAQEKMDWDYLLRKSLTHALMPLMCQCLEAAQGAAPETVLDQFRQHFRNNAKRNLLLTAELLRLVQLLADQGIPNTPHKGPLLAETLYGDIALRQFCDLDILIHERDAERAGELLRSQGYVAPHFESLGMHEAEYASFRREYTFVRNDGKAAVELEWDIMSEGFPFRVNLARVWERRRPVTLAGRRLLTFSPEDLLIVSCVQGAAIYWMSPFGRMCDMARLLSVHKEMDWDYVLKAAHTAGGARILYLGLSFASKLFGAALPPDVSRRVESDPTARSLFHQICRRLLREEAGRPTERELNLFNIQVRERLQDKMLYILLKALMPTEQEWNLISLPRPLFPLYSVIRPSRLVAKNTLGLLRKLLPLAH